MTQALSFLRERAGRAIGWAWAPAIAAVARARHARIFHPDGIALSAHVVACDGADDAAARVGARLAGPALVRFSSAIWKGDSERIDALGCAVRFGARAKGARLEEHDAQDLLFATIRSPWTMPFAPLTTKVHDFLENVYFAVAPFDVEGVGRAKWRLVREGVSHAHGERRRDKLMDAVANGATLRLELRRTWHRAWQPVARIVLEAPAGIDQEALRFDAFRDGRGIVPRGLVHALRRGAYAASQRVRPERATERARSHAS